MTPPRCFLAAAVALLAQELFPCRAQLLRGGLGGRNRERVLRHLAAGYPVLVPYPLNLGFFYFFFGDLPIIFGTPPTPPKKKFEVLMSF